MKILWLGLEHELGIEDKHEVLIMNKDTFDMSKVNEFVPDVLIEREFNDGISIYDEEIKHIKKRYPNCKTIMWFIDTHVQYQRHRESI